VLALREYFRSQQQSLTVEIADVRTHPFCREAILDVLRNYPEEPSGSASCFESYLGSGSLLMKTAWRKETGKIAARGQPRV
jgi:hypothetical protein